MHIDLARHDEHLLLIAGPIAGLKLDMTLQQALWWLLHLMAAYPVPWFISTLCPADGHRVQVAGR